MKLLTYALSPYCVNLVSAATALITPHEQYSSSIGVLGCKINTNRVAYWPSAVDCNEICISLHHQGRTVHLLKVDSSGGAYDISYDAWNYLTFGQNATEHPYVGGAVSMEYDTVSMDHCVADGLLQGAGGKLPLSAANSMNFVSWCLQGGSNWVSQNHVLYNIQDPLCKYGVDEICNLDVSLSNQPSCPSALGSTALLGLSYQVWNIEYGTGQEVSA